VVRDELRTKGTVVKLEMVPYAGAGRCDINLSVEAR
jgi:hypothetical protein